MTNPACEHGRDLEFPCRECDAQNPAITLQAENAKLRAALEQALKDICNYCCTHDTNLGPHCQACLDIQDVLEKRD